VHGEIPAVILVLVGGLVLSLVGMLSAFAETRAVHALKAWPFHLGVPVVRIRGPHSFFRSPSDHPTLTRSAELRVLSTAECVFVPQDWRSHVSWSYYPQRASPYALKGSAVSDHRGVEVVGRLSLAASLGIPGLMVWLGGCGILALRQSPGMGAVLLFAGIVLPAGLTWATLPNEIRRFRDLLVQGGVMATVRKTRGDDIDAACGQLRGQVLDRTQVRLGSRLIGVAVRP